MIIITYVQGKYFFSLDILDVEIIIIWYCMMKYINIINKMKQNETLVAQIAHFF